MYYSRAEEEGRALAYVGSVLLGVGIVALGSVTFVCREMLRSLRERRSESWQPVSAQITTSDVKAVHGRFVDYAIGKVGYAYSVEDTYCSGYLARQFWDEQRAWTFVDQCQNRQVMIKYKPNRPKASVLALRDLYVTERYAFRPTSRTKHFSPWLALLWSLRNVSNWAETSLQNHASNWPSAEGTVEYAEPMMVGTDDDLHWVGDLHYKYSVDGSTYTGSRYFRAYSEGDAREEVEPWRGRKVIIHYFSGNPARSVFIEREQPAVTQSSDNASDRGV